MTRKKNPYFIHASAPATPTATNNPEPWTETTIVGKPTPRVDAYERVSGTAVYTTDVILPDMLHAAIARCPHPHARVKSIDTSAAAKIPGVAIIMTGKDPETDIPWFETEQGATSKLFDDHCRYAGEEVAVVAAETEYQAWDAVRSIKVEYEELPFVSDYEKALASGAPAIHGDSNLVMPPVKYERGNVDAAFADPDAVIVEETYRTSCEIHTPTEVHGSVAKWDGNRLTVWDSTQGVFDIQQTLAQVLKLPQSHVRVIGHYMGGGFGSKLDLGKYTVMAALLARKTARPVKLTLTREEEYLCVGNRPATTITMKGAAKKDGTLLALSLKNTGVAGAYPGGTFVSGQTSDLYLCPNVRAEETMVYINAGKERAFRAPGFPQGNWALEQLMDALAEKIGMDPVEFRLKNIPTFSQRQNKPYTSTGLARCISEGAKTFGWNEARAKAKREGDIRRGVGMAAGQWGYAGGPPSTAIIKLFADGSANLNIGISDIGTGAKTVMTLVVAEELGVPLDLITMEHADTETSPYATPSGGSKTVPSDSPAVRAAAIQVKQKLIAMAAEQLEAPESDLVYKNGVIASTVQPDKKLALKDVKRLQDQQVVLGVGYRAPNPPDKVAKPFAAQFCELEVNMRTGEIRILRFLGAHDSGRAMNPLTYRNQVYGGITMGIGFALMENRLLDGNNGKMVNCNWHDYKVPTAKDVPTEWQCLPIDPHDTEYNSTGAKGLGEPATIPTGAAIANAVYHATGLRMTDAPISPSRLLQRIADQGKRS